MCCLLSFGARLCAWSLSALCLTDAIAAGQVHLPDFLWFCYVLNALNAFEDAGDWIRGLGLLSSLMRALS